MHKAITLPRTGPGKSIWKGPFFGFAPLECAEYSESRTCDRAGGGGVPLARALPQYSRALLKAWIESGAVQVDGRPLRAKDKVLGGEQVRIEAQLAAHTAAAAEAIALAVAFQDPSLFIINKPPGLVVHPGAGNPRHTLQNA